MKRAGRHAPAVSMAMPSVALLGLVGGTAAVGGDWQAATVAMHASQVGLHSWYVRGGSEAAQARNQGFMSNAGFVITNTGVVVFDALATPALAERLLREIRQRSSLPILRVIVSHYHADHFYGAGVFQAQGASLWAFDTAQAYLASDIALARLAQRRRDLGAWLGESFVLPRPDHWLHGDERFELGGVRFQIRHVGPAHTPDDLIMLVEPDGVLYAGDVLYAGRLPYVGDADSATWLAALDQVGALGARVVVPGHGAATTHPRTDIALTRDYLQFLRSAMGAAASQLEDFDQVYARTDWSRFAALPSFGAANRANAYNVFLQMEREQLAQH